MKTKLRLLFILFISVAVSTQAQQGFQKRSVEERVKFTMQRVNDSLKLDANQQSRTDSVFTSFYRSMDKLREGLEPGTRPDKTQMEKILDERDEQLKKIWEDEQFKKYKEMEIVIIK